MVFAGWVNREQQAIIEFYQAELTVVMDAQGKKRLLLTDETRRLLAVKGKSLGRKTLMEVTTIVTPDTIMIWHRTGARSETANLMEDIHQVTLGRIGSDRLHDH